MTPNPEYIGTEVIMDGRILDGNLKRMGVDFQVVGNKNERARL